MKNKKYKFIYMIMILLLLGIGVAFAILQANLQINGTAKIANNSWDIHFDNIVVNQDSVPIGTGDTAATIDQNNDCKVDFSVTLSLPGDFYEFTVDVVNAGTIDGMIGTLTKTLKVDGVVVETVPSYLNYTVTYEDGGPILDNHLLAKNTQETYKVRVEYKTDIDELPDAATISTAVEVQYVQADDTAVKKKPYNPCTYDGELVQGAEYTNGQYTYRYMQEFNGSDWTNISTDGWGVTLTDKDSTEPVTSKLCTSINDKPIVSMKYMFNNSKTTNIDTSSFDTSNVTIMNAMFQGCSSLTSLDLSGFDTENVTAMVGMFNGCSSLTALDLSNFVTSSVTNMNVMFQNCSRLTSLNLSSFDTSKVTNMQAMFSGCSSLIELDLSGFNLSKANSFTMIASGIFNGTTSLKKLNLSNMKLPVDMSDSIFRNSGASSSPIEEIDVTGWDLSYTTNATGMFGSNGSSGKGGSGLKRIIGINTWDTSQITNMSQMFNGLSSLTNLDLSSFNTSNVTTMYTMFYGCASLISLDLSSFNLTKISDSNNLGGMFYGCSSLTTGYARTSSDAEKLNASGGKPTSLTFVVKS